MGSQRVRHDLATEQQPQNNTPGMGIDPSRVQVYEAWAVDLFSVSSWFGKTKSKGVLSSCLYAPGRRCVHDKYLLIKYLFEK